jgi:hypothetical protein
LREGLWKQLKQYVPRFTAAGMAPEVHDARGHGERNWHGERNPAHQAYTQGRTKIRDRPLG